jgi:transcriptional regulator with XRE-family HTH domain
MEKNSNFKERLNKAIKDKRIRAYELSNMTGISRPLISNYLHGYAEPGQANTTKIAKALGVNEIWLIGYDVPMEVITPTTDDLKDEVIRMVNNLGEGDLAKVKLFIKEILK